jgi:opacity protein-like surface antigen
MIRIVVLAVSAVLCGAVNTAAQVTPRPPAPSRPVEIGGYAMLGLMNFTAADTFDVGAGSPYGSIFGGGARVGLPLGGLFINVGAWQFRDRGQRVFVFEGEEFPLGIPLNITITPLEIGGGWQFRFRRAPQVRPYVTGGFTSYGYKETSEFATDAENVDERFTGYHLAGGVDFPVQQWIGVGWELNWTTVPDAIGGGGLSAEFDETNLGGVAFRFKITIGR